ncbi:MAG: tyrosine-protein phosphatase, partial [Bacteroidaceae bacterium]|nr:tyrosine-protein phosphatase [Bacteroidaceae bacterium]
MKLRALFLFGSLLALATSAQRWVVLHHPAAPPTALPIERVTEISFADSSSQSELAIANIVNPMAGAYLAEVDYSGHPYDYSHIKQYLPPPTVRGDHPTPIRCSSPVADAQWLRYFDHNGWPHILPLTDGATTLPPLLPQRTYRLQWLSAIDAPPMAETALYVEGNLRMIALEAMHNVRDCGGWTAMRGKRVRHGLLFRGGEIHHPQRGLVATPNDIRQLLDLGIRAELDLRGNVESGYLTASPLGDEVRYYRIAGGGIYPYVDMIMRFPDDIREVFHTVLGNLRDQRPTYIHCHLGADRTGTVMMLLNGILGV